MRGRETDIKLINKIKNLRSHGMTVNEISSNLLISKSLVSKYIQGVKIKHKYFARLTEKQGGSKSRSEKQWELAENRAVRLVGKLNSRDKVLILASLYWGEGTKREFNIINSDPKLLRVFIDGIKYIGVSTGDIVATLRIYGDISKNEAISYWSKELVLQESQFIGVNILEGKKNGKLKYGMCRIRVKKGGVYFKTVMELIRNIKQQCR